MEIKDFTYRSICIGCGDDEYSSSLLAVINDETITLACDGILIWYKMEEFLLLEKGFFEYVLYVNFLSKYSHLYIYY